MTSPSGITWEQTFDRVRTEWAAMTTAPPPDHTRFDEVKRQADDLVDAGKWTSGPSDMLSVLGRQRNELTHSKLLGWLLTPTGRHGLGRSFLTRLTDALWPGDDLLRSGPVFVETEVTAAGADALGLDRAARADIVVRGDQATIVIENKLDAGEQPDQCERLYWSWAAEPGDTRWLFLTPTGRSPVSVTSASAAAAWRAMSYADIRQILELAIETVAPSEGAGRATATQYLATLTASAGVRA